MKIRILVVTTSYPLQQNSVSGIFVKRLVDALAKLVEVRVIAPCGRDSAPVSDDARLRCFRYAPRAMQVLAQGAGGIPAALRERPTRVLLVPLFMGAMLVAVLAAARRTDVIQANWSIGGLLAGLAGKLTATPVVTTLRGEDVSAAEKSLLYAALLKLSVVLSDRVVTVSQAMAGQLAARYPARQHKIVTIHNGVDDALLDARRSPPDQATRRLLFVGSLIPRKGVDLLLRAMASLDTDLELWLAGEGNQTDPLRQLADALNLSGRVRFLGRVPPAEVPALYEVADALVLPSHSEGRPNVIMEAMAAGLPVIASDIPGVREVIRPGENGLLFAAGDVQALAAAMRELLGDAGLKTALSQGGRQYIRDNNLYWSACARQYHQLFADVLEGRS